MELGITGMTVPKNIKKFQIIYARSLFCKLNEQIGSNEEQNCKNFIKSYRISVFFELT